MQVVQSVPFSAWLCECDIKTLVEEKRKSRILGARYSILHGGGKPEWGSPQNVHFVGSPVGGGYNTPMPVDVKFVRFYPLTLVWERYNFIKQEDIELFSEVGDGARKT